jgi:hypothetical protein
MEKFAHDLTYLAAYGGELVEIKKLPICCENFDYEDEKNPQCKEDAAYAFSYETHTKYFCAKHAEEYAKKNFIE